MPDDQVPISALQHWAFCPRQAALIHVERAWADNRDTVLGHLAHERVHEPGVERLGRVRIERALPVWSERLNLIGVCDVVEIDEDTGAVLPVEHKQGPRKSRRADEIQLCAQALCLEEMLGTPVPQGALYHRKSRHRRLVPLDSALRAQTEAAVASVAALLAAAIGACLPAPVADARCARCSLLDRCMPALPRERVPLWLFAPLPDGAEDRLP